MEATGSFVATAAHPESLMASPIASSVCRCRHCNRDTSTKAGTIKERTVKPGVAIITKDWSASAKPGERGYRHTAVAERGGMQMAETFLLIIHLVFSNLKT